MASRGPIAARAKKMLARLTRPPTAPLFDPLPFAPAQAALFVSRTTEGRTTAGGRRAADTATAAALMASPPGWVAESVELAPLARRRL